MTDLEICRELIAEWLGGECGFRIRGIGMPFGDWLGRHPAPAHRDCARNQGQQESTHTSAAERRHRGRIRARNRPRTGEARGTGRQSEEIREDPKVAQVADDPLNPISTAVPSTKTNSIAME